MFSLVEMSRFTAIPVRPNTKEELRQMGVKGETYDEIIQRLIKKFQSNQFIEDEKRRLANFDPIPESRNLDDATQLLLRHLKTPHLGFSSEDEEEDDFL